MYYEQLYWFLAIAKPLIAVGVIVAITLSCLIYGEERNKRMDYNDDGPFDPWNGEQWALDDEDGDRILIGQEPHQFDTRVEQNGDK